MSRPSSVTVGMRVGCLVVQERVGSVNGVGLYRCLCDCGSEPSIRQNNLKSGNSRTCGDPRYHTRNLPRKPIPPTILFDEDDREMLERYAWHISDSGYAVNRSRGVTVRMHRLVLGLCKREGGMEVDHINGNPLDNRKENLRIVERIENTRNLRNVRKNSSTGERGVTRLKDGRFKARVTLNYRSHSLGIYNTLEEAAEIARSWRLKNMPGATN